MCHSRACINNFNWPSCLFAVQWYSSTCHFYLHFLLLQLCLPLMKAYLSTLERNLFKLKANKVKIFSSTLNLKTFFIVTESQVIVLSRRKNINDYVLAINKWIPPRFHFLLMRSVFLKYFTSTLPSYVNTLFILGFLCVCQAFLQLL